MKVKMYNEYGDRLVDVEIATLLKSLGFDKQGPECYVIEHKESATIHDAWTGLIPDDMAFFAHRPTLKYAQTWIRENYDIIVHLKYAGICKGDDNWEDRWSVYVDKHYSHLMTEYDIHDEYDMALQSGIIRALQIIIEKNL